MPLITDTPSRKNTAGHEFNFNVWSAGSRVVLANVPWNNDYRDIVKFADHNALNTYLMGTPTSIVDVGGTTYLKPGQPIRLNVPFNNAYKFNYLRAYNPAVSGDSARDYYYFITDVRYIAPDTTEFVVQLDVWQSFGLSAEFGMCYIERGHIGVANTNQMYDSGREFLTIPEGLDVGGEYGIGHSYSHTIGNNIHNHPDNVDIILATTISLEGSGGTVDEPLLVSARGSNFEGLPNGCEFYHFNSVAVFKIFMGVLSAYPWVAAGVVSIMAVPDLENPPVEQVTTLNGMAVSRLTGSSGINSLITLAASDNWRESLLLSFYPSRYRHLKKFLTYPYTVVELTTNTGNPLVLKPESMQSGGITVMEMLHLALPNPRVCYYPYKYNAAQYSAGGFKPDLGVNDQAEFLDMTTGIMNLPTFSVVNNGYMQFMASNANSIAYQHNSADWSQQKALQGNQLSASQATAGMGATNVTSTQNMRTQQMATNIQNDTAMASAITSGASAMASGAMAGPAGLAAAGAGTLMMGANAAIQTDARNRQTAASLAGQQSNLNTQLGLAGYVRDSNKEFADFAATGDYQNTIAAITAKVQDAKLTQPTTAGQMGGDAFLLSNHKWELLAKVKTVVGASRNSIGEYWLRYGYAFNRFAKPPADLMVMDKFTYWKMKETYLTSLGCPETFKQVIRGIFEKGVTVWANPADIGNIDIGDNPVSGS